MIGYLDCYSGISGDMMLGALVDVGLPIQHLEAVALALGLHGEVRVSAEAVDRAGVQATRLLVETLGETAPRPLAKIARLLESSTLPPSVRATSLTVLTRIAEVEGKIHGLPASQVELHEVGALDAIFDVVGTVSGLAALQVDALYSSPLPISPGDIRGGGHLHLPGPAPATMALLAAAHAPVRPFGDGRELVTPTGAALLTTLARFEQPAMRLEQIGYGAGSAETPWPNVLRLWIGQAHAEETAAAAGHVVLETNLDDMNPQLLAAATEELFAAGALDVTVSPLLMKKGRAGWLVTVIARAGDESGLAKVLLQETTTLGVRVHVVRRYEAERRQAEVDTPFGRVAVKLKLLDGAVVGAVPEFESVREVATSAHAKLLAVHAAAAAAALTLLAPAGGPNTRPTDERPNTPRFAPGRSAKPPPASGPGARCGRDLG